MNIYKSVKSVMYGDAEDKTPVSSLLKGGSIVYGGAVSLRSSLYSRGVLRVKKLPKPVISIGNLTVGGTGKTPAVIMVAERLLKMGKKPVILSRGYKREGGNASTIVSDGDTLLADRRYAGDEPYMIAKRLKGVPVVVGSNRFASGLLALERFEVNVFILDDGFQRIQLHRDLNILLIDSKNPFGNGHLLPRGILREPIEAAARADIIILTKCDSDSVSIPPQIPNHIPIALSATTISKLISVSNGETQPIEIIKGKKVAAFCGIGSPESFADSLKDAGAEVLIFKSFPDHHAYSSNDINEILSEAVVEGVDYLVTTEKDSVKLSKNIRAAVPLLFVSIDMTLLKGGDSLNAAIRNIFSSK
ncbi:MAG: tetraacyldisaccharide 4'-kinase [Nitrospinota bacterium]|nr:tetraacyldisaccharide 4'-kinase [Nitrospinota bacterium]